MACEDSSSVAITHLLMVFPEADFSTVTQAVGQALSLVGDTSPVTLLDQAFEIYLELREAQQETEVSGFKPGPSNSLGHKSENDTHTSADVTASSSNLPGPSKATAISRPESQKLKQPGTAVSTEASPHCPMDYEQILPGASNSHGEGDVLTEVSRQQDESSEDELNDKMADDLNEDLESGSLEEEDDGIPWDKSGSDEEDDAEWDSGSEENWSGEKDRETKDEKSKKIGNHEQVDEFKGKKKLMLGTFSEEEDGSDRKNLVTIQTAATDVVTNSKVTSFHAEAMEEASSASVSCDNSVSCSAQSTVVGDDTANSGSPVVRSGTETAVSKGSVGRVEEDETFTSGAGTIGVVGIDQVTSDKDSNSTNNHQTDGRSITSTDPTSSVASTAPIDNQTGNETSENEKEESSYGKDIDDDWDSVVLSLSHEKVAKEDTGEEKAADILSKTRDESASLMLKDSTKVDQDHAKIDDEDEWPVLRSCRKLVSRPMWKSPKEEKKTIIDLTDDNDDVDGSSGSSGSTLKDRLDVSVTVTEMESESEDDEIPDLIEFSDECLEINKKDPKVDKSSHCIMNVHQLIHLGIAMENKADMCSSDGNDMPIQRASKVSPISPLSNAKGISDIASMSSSESRGYHNMKAMDLSVTKSSSSVFKNDTSVSPQRFSTDSNKLASDVLDSVTSSNVLKTTDKTGLDVLSTVACLESAGTSTSPNGATAPCYSPYAPSTSSGVYSTLVPASVQSQVLNASATVPLLTKPFPHMHSQAHVNPVLTPLALVTSRQSESSREFAGGICKNQPLLTPSDQVDPAVSALTPTSTVASHQVSRSVGKPCLTSPIIPPPSPTDSRICLELAPVKNWLVSSAVSKSTAFKCHSALSSQATLLSSSSSLQNNTSLNNVLSRPQPSLGSTSVSVMEHSGTSGSVSSGMRNLQSNYVTRLPKTPSNVIDLSSGMWGSNVTAASSESHLPGTNAQGSAVSVRSSASNPANGAWVNEQMLAEASDSGRSYVEVIVARIRAQNKLFGVSDNSISANGATATIYPEAATATVATPKFIPDGLSQDTTVDTQNSERRKAQYNSPCPAQPAPSNPSHLMTASHTVSSNHIRSMVNNFLNFRRRLSGASNKGVNDISTTMEQMARMTARKRRADDSLPMDVDSGMQNCNGVMNNDNTSQGTSLFGTLPVSRAGASQSNLVSVIPRCSAAPPAPKAFPLTAEQSIFSQPPKPGFQVVKQTVKSPTGRQCINTVYVPQQSAAGMTIAVSPPYNDAFTVSSGTCPSASVSSTSTVTNKSVSISSTSSTGSVSTQSLSTRDLESAHSQHCSDAKKLKMSTDYRKPAEDVETDEEEMNCNEDSDSETSIDRNDAAIMVCEACDLSSPICKSAQCSSFHIICGTCVEEEIRDVMASEKMYLSCPMEGCNDIIMLESVCDLLSPLVLDLLRHNIQQKEQKASQQAISNMEGFVTCPVCSYSGLLDDEILHFICGNPACRKECCRHCKADFRNAVDHVGCSILSFVGVDCFTNPSEFPANWDLTEKNFTRVVVPLTSKEGVEIKKFYSQTSRWQVQRIFRIQNRKLWEKYVLERKHMQEEIKEVNLRERLLFHGTRLENVPKIGQEGFDLRIPVANGAAYGKGIYFSTVAQYSEKYAQGSRTVIIARVLCGHSTQGAPHLTRPPYDHNGRMYDSCVENSARPSMYIIFNPAQCYPQYMVEIGP